MRKKSASGVLASSEVQRTTPSCSGQLGVGPGEKGYALAKDTGRSPLVPVRKRDAFALRTLLRPAERRALARRGWAGESRSFWGYPDVIPAITPNGIECFKSLLKCSCPGREESAWLNDLDGVG